MTLFRLEIPAGDYEGRILADCDTVRLDVPGVGAVQVPVDAVAPVPPPLPAEPPNGFVGRLGTLVWMRSDSGVRPESPARWYEPGNPSAFTWEQVCGFNPDEKMIELRPDPAVNSPNLPWIWRVDDGCEIHVEASAAWRDRLFVEVDSTHLERDTVRQLAAALWSWLAAADQAESAALRSVPEGETN